MGQTCTQAQGQVGWIGELHPMVTVGATYVIKVFMTEFKKYDGLFADDLYPKTSRSASPSIYSPNST